MNIISCQALPSMNFLANAPTTIKNASYCKLLAYRQRMASRSSIATAVTSLVPTNQRPSACWDEISVIAISVDVRRFVPASAQIASVRSNEPIAEFVGAMFRAWATSFSTLGSRTSSSTSGWAVISAVPAIVAKANLNGIPAPSSRRSRELCSYSVWPRRTRPSQDCRIAPQV